MLQSCVIRKLTPTLQVLGIAYPLIIIEDSKEKLSVHKDREGIAETQGIVSILEQSGMLLLFPRVTRPTLEEACNESPHIYQSQRLREVSGRSETFKVEKQRQHELLHAQNTSISLIDG